MSVQSVGGYLFLLLTLGSLGSDLKDQIGNDLQYVGHEKYQSTAYYNIFYQGVWVLWALCAFKLELANFFTTGFGLTGLSGLFGH